MNPGQLLLGHLRCFDFMQAVVDLRGHQLIPDGNQPLRAFRVAYPHIVLQADGMGDVGSESISL